MSLASGTKVGPYEIVAPLGEGGMGTVYRALDTKLNRPVAIKFLSNELADATARRRFQREAQMASSLNHPHILTVHDAGEFENRQYLVTEFVDGGTLKDWARAEKRNWTQIVELLTGVADGLAAAHAAGITHRDIKPANILVAKNGYAKLADFGLAKLDEVAPQGDATVTLIEEATRPGMIMGTIAYMSPEQASGRPVDARSDIFSFGVLLHELLAGRKPFGGATDLEVLQTILHGVPQPLAEDVPAALRAVVERALEKDAAERYQSMGEMVADLRRLVRHDAGAPVPPKPDRPLHSLAVLPFANASSDPQMEYLSDGLTENIIFSLSRLPQLRVISQSAVFRYKGRSDEAQHAGQAFGVEAVLTGKVLQRGETLLISAELVDVENGWQRWGAQYRRKAADIFAIEEEIAKEISENLRLKLTPEKENLPARRYTDNVEAYHLYLKGRFYWAKRTEEGLYKGIQYFRQAIELDPTYALAYAGVAEGYVPLAVYCHLAPKDACSKSRAAAHAALEIDAKLAEARTVLGAVMSYYDWDLENAEKELRQATALDPKYARAHQALAENLTMSGRFEEAAVEARRALELDPLALSLNAFMAMTYYFGREYDKAIEHGSRTVEMDPNFFPGYFYLGMAYHVSGQFADAAAALQQARVLSNNSTLMVASLGGVFAAWGKHEEARNILHELEQMGRRKYVSQVFVAAILAGLGEIDQALACLETAYEHRCTWLPRCIAADARLDRLHREARLQDLIRRMGISN
jgi:eukaryotic-like serine/threonine-protein kinase